MGGAAAFARNISGLGTGSLRWSRLAEGTGTLRWSAPSCTVAGAVGSQLPALGLTGTLR